MSASEYGQIAAAEHQPWTLMVFSFLDQQCLTMLESSLHGRCLQESAYHFSCLTIGSEFNNKRWADEWLIMRRLDPSCIEDQILVQPRLGEDCHWTF